MGAAEWIALAGLVLTFVVVSGGGALRFHRWLNRIEGKVDATEQRTVQLAPNGNRALAEGGHLFDAVHRMEGKLDLLGIDISDQRQALITHVATSDLEHAELRKALRRSDG